MVACTSASIAIAASVAIDPAAESVAQASMLRALDLPWPADPSGVSYATSDDLPGYAEHGGLRVASQQWASFDTYLVVQDTRWQFPDASSSRAFLDEAEQDLGETTGGARALDPPVVPLPDTRYFVRSGFGEVHTFLLHHGNLVGKVRVDATPAGARDIASGLASAAATRMVAALGGPPAPSDPPDPTPDPAATAELLTRIPTGIAQSCEARASKDGVLAHVACSPSTTATVEYTLFDSALAVKSSVVWTATFAREFGSMSDAGTCLAGGYDGQWPEAGPPQGQLICYEHDGMAVIVWSDDAARIVGLLEARDADHETAYELWLEARQITT
jgi:hypothetical protein